MDRREQTPPNPYRACQEALVRKIQSGDLDIGRFYSVETTDAGLTAIDLPAGIMTKRSQNAPVSFLLGSKGVSAAERAWALVDPPGASRPRYVDAASHSFVAGALKASVSTASIQRPPNTRRIVRCESRPDDTTAA